MSRWCSGARCAQREWIVSLRYVNLTGQEGSFSMTGRVLFH